MSSVLLATHESIFAINHSTTPKASNAVSARFSDVPLDHPYFDAIEWAAVNGITVGYGSGKYGPDDLVTRAQMALFLKRLADKGDTE